MISPANPERPAAIAAEPKLYSSTFWWAYAAHFLLVTGNALTFRFAELVAHLGGSEQTAGEVVSIGVIVALVIRFFLGQMIDRYGTRRLWTTGTVLFVISCLMFLSMEHLGWQMYAGRIFFSIALATMFTCSIVHIQGIAPAHRRTEVIGTLGSSGFLGMVTGAQVGDFIFNTWAAPQMRFGLLFGLAAALGVVYLVIIRAITRNDRHDRPESTPAAHRLILRHWPGMIILVAMMMGLSFIVVSVFLTRFSTYRGLGGIGWFFTGYATSAFLFRLATRNWSRLYGRHSMVVAGLIGHALGQLAFPWVTTQWQLLIPSALAGFGHALLFPAVISLGAGVFPKQYRGTGTTLVLGFVDLGSALFAPVLGAIIDSFAEPGFTQMFLASSGMVTIVLVLYLLTAARQPDFDNDDLSIETDRPTMPDSREPIVPLGAPTPALVPAGERTGFSEN